MIRMFSCNIRSFLLLVTLSIFLVTLLVSQVGDRYGYSIPRIPKISWNPSSIIGSHDKPASPPQEPDVLKDAPDDIAHAPSRPLPEAGVRYHPIDTLLMRANREFEDLLKKETKGLNAAAKAYVDRRGKQPPPGFDQWVKFAEDNEALMVEDFFDQIYHDLEPLGALSAQTLREATLAWPYWISVRNGELSTRKKEQDAEVSWLGLWSAMLKDVSHLLPDVDMAVNVMDESRLLVSWEDIDRYMQLGEQHRKDSPFPNQKSDVVTKFPKLPVPTYEPEKYSHDMIGSGPMWALAREACPPESAGRTASYEIDYSLSPQFPRGYPEGSFDGYVQNWTSATDPCIHSHLRGLHGSFIEPVSMSVSKKLYPLFGGSKLPMNNEILIPPAMYWTDDPFYSGGDQHVPWEEKSNKIIWRGSASGGRHKEGNWKRFQRHRLVSMLNGTQVHAATLGASGMLDDIDNVFPQNFPPPERGLYNLVTAQSRKLGEWLTNVAEATFSHLLCFPRTGNKAICPYNDKYYRVSDYLPMKDQYKYKYLPDVDGNSFSGRYRAFLLSNSVPIKATIYKEWHDSRLVPWKHFVPMDNTFKDIWGILEYFLGYDGDGEGEPDLTAWPDPNDIPSPHGMPDAAPVADGELGGFYGGYGSPNSKSAPDGASDPGPIVRFPEDSDIDGSRIVTAPGEAPTGPPLARSHPVNEAKEKFKRQQHHIHAPSHEAQAKAIAEAGRDWSLKVLRHVDMQIYFYRLILEFARLCSQDRDRMAWISDDHDFTSDGGANPDEPVTNDAWTGQGYNGHEGAKAGYGAWSDGASPAMPDGHKTVADGGAPIEEGPGGGHAAGAKTEGVGHGAAGGTGGDPHHTPSDDTRPGTPEAAPAPDLPPGRNRFPFEHGYLGAPPMAPPPSTFETDDVKVDDAAAPLPGVPPAAGADTNDATAPGVDAHLGAAHDPKLDIAPADPVSPGAHLGAAVGADGSPGGVRVRHEERTERFNPEGADEGSLWKRRWRKWSA